MREEKLDGTGGVALPARGREEAVPDVHLSGLEPGVTEVVVHPTHEPLAGPDAGNRSRSVGSRAEPPEELLVATRDQQLRIARARLAQGYDAVARDHRSRRESLRSLRTRPPVWQSGQ